MLLHGLVEQRRFRVSLASYREKVCDYQAGNSGLLRQKNAEALQVKWPRFFSITVPTGLPASSDSCFLPYRASSSRFKGRPVVTNSIFALYLVERKTDVKGAPVCLIFMGYEHVQSCTFVNKIRYEQVVRA
jgi:hypothetical protein